MDELDGREPAELDKVETWQLHVLLEAGYSLKQASQLQVGLRDHQFDLHEAVELVKPTRPGRKACSHETALKILL